MNREFDDSMDRLGRDVSFLGRVLGNVLREQGGDALFDAVENLRTACRHHRQYHCGEAAEQVAERVAALPLDLALQVTRAFTTYFHLINIAEENHRVRRLEEREAASFPDPRPESIRSAILELRNAGVAADEVRDLVQGLAIRPVFTAHPTEARRMTLLRQLQRIAGLVKEIDETVSPEQRRRLIDRLYAEVSDLWQTNELRVRDQTPLDEVRNGLYYFDNSVFSVTALVYREMRDALREWYPSLDADVPAFLTFGSWIGGDRDGNPNITPAVTERTLRMHKSLVLEKYIGSVQRLSELLTTSSRLTGCSKAIQASLERDEREFGTDNAEQSQRRSEEPYRRKLLFSLERLRNTLARNEAAGSLNAAGLQFSSESPYYESAGRFLDDLRLISESLVQHGGARIADDVLQDLIWQVRTFGFHLARLDVRQHRDRHVRAVQELLGLDDWEGSDEDRRMAILENALTSPVSDLNRQALTDETQETLAVFDVIRRMQAELGTEAVDTYVISFTTRASDLLSVLYLARLTGLVDFDAGRSSLKVVPLFETAADLEAAPRIMGALYASSVYGRQIQAWNREQEIMLGYSDSDKDSGYLTSNVSLYRAQQSILRGADEAGVRVTFFHGRGGAIGRGGGPLQRAILGQPGGTVRGRIKVTEQGEVLFTRYANPGIAHRHLEQLINAVVRASSPAMSRPIHVQSWEETANELSQSAEATYRDLLADEGDFLRFFDEGTPLRSITRLRIASRPAKRGAGELELASLRAIPWVFAWTQARWGVPGWFGLGSALQAAVQRGRLEELQTMYRGWPFFRWVIDAAQISLGKADIGIARTYATLVTDTAVRERYLHALQDEFERTVRTVNAVIGQDSLLDSWPVLQRSIELRNPYVDPMSYLQVRCLRELRADPEGRDGSMLRSIIDRSITGVAAGLQNTG